MKQKNRLKAVYLLPCGGSTPGWQICGNTNVKYCASLPVGLQAAITILRSAFPFRMKAHVIAFFAFFRSIELTILLRGLLRWCSNQSPGPGAVPSSTRQHQLARFCLSR
ncbi:TPA: hypothetical protein I3821_000908 [Enterobacter cloacae]|nr:hypothetical protein [Enterobacter cloacae]HAS1441787.1 hypothetical protein [Enterobacter cloacae]